MTGGGRGSRLWVSPRLSVMAVTSSIGTVRVRDLTRACRSGTRSRTGTPLIIEAPRWQPLRSKDHTAFQPRDETTSGGTPGPQAAPASSIQPYVLEGPEFAEHMGTSTTRNVTYAANPSGFRQWLNAA